MQTNKELASEAQTLSNALKRPDVRGRWGETQLERVLELSGLRKDIDFTVQDSFDSEGERIRTDVIVHLPQDRTVILDSKVSLTALMEAFETDDDDTRSAAFDRHVSQVKSHVDSLARNGILERPCLDAGHGGNGHARIRLSPRHRTGTRADGTGPGKERGYRHAARPAGAAQGRGNVLAADSG